MTDRYALVGEGGLVENVVLWDGEAEWLAPPGLTATQAPPEVGPGWRIQAGEWLAPEATP